ncbi:MAG: winged helix-turn-helix transcriptional regulator, partial [Gammaproteobacteria bacterium]|nr:winged helix-turn-helix transcriptional regulator [Gammaproteobacteria bacterium]
CQRLAHAEEASIREALRHNNGHRGKTAAELGISVTTLWRRMRRFENA